MKYLERTTEQLFMWELAMGSEQPPFNGDPEKVRQELEKRLKKVKTMNTIVALSHSQPNEDLELSRALKLVSAHRALCSHGRCGIPMPHLPG